MAGWLLLPHRPTVVWPLWLHRARRPDVAARPARRVPRAGGRRARRAGRPHRAAVRLARRPRRGPGRASPPSSRCGRATARGRCLDALGRRAAARRRHRRGPAATPTSSAAGRRTGPTTARLLVPHRAADDRRRDAWPPRSTTSGRGTCRSARCSSTRGGTRTRSCARSTPTSGSCRRPAWCGGRPRDDVLPDGIGRPARGARRPAAGRALPAPVVAVALRRRVRGAGSTATAPTRQGADLLRAAGSTRRVGWGVEIFEHDWLIECFLGVRRLRAVPGRARAWQEGIDRAAGDAGPHAAVVHGVARPTSARPPTLRQRHLDPHAAATTATSSAPVCCGPGSCYVNVIARALGLRPYKDVFRRPRRPVGARRGGGAAVGAVDGPGRHRRPRRARPTRRSSRRTCRSDGMLVKPDVPVAALDRCLDRHVIASRRLLVGATSTQHRAGTWHYVLAANARADGAERGRADRAGRARRRRAGRRLELAHEVGRGDRRRWRLARSSSDRTTGTTASWRQCCPAGWRWSATPTLYVTAGDRRLADVTPRR